MVKLPPELLNFMEYIQGIWKSACAFVSECDASTLFLISFFLLTIVISVILFILEKTRIKKVKKNSYKYKRLIEINEKYTFYDLPDKKEVCRKYPTLQKYKRRDFETELFCELRDEQEYGRLIKEAEKNKVFFRSYCQEVEAVEDTSTQTILDSKMPHKEFLRIERKIFEDTKLRPKLGFDVVISTEYTSPAGRNHYEEKMSFTYDKVKKAYDDMIDKIERQNSEEAKRRIERAKMTASLRYNVLRRDGFRCQICGASQDDGAKLHVDHIVPVSKGGKTEMSNLRTLCDMCNLGKSDKIE